MRDGNFFWQIVTLLIALLTFVAYLVVEWPKIIKQFPGASLIARIAFGIFFGVITGALVGLAYFYATEAFGNSITGRGFSARIRFEGPELEGLIGRNSTIWAGIGLVFAISRQSTNDFFSKSWRRILLGFILGGLAGSLGAGLVQAVYNPAFSPKQTMWYVHIISAEFAGGVGGIFLGSVWAGLWESLLTPFLGVQKVPNKKAR